MECLKPKTEERCDSDSGLRWRKAALILWCIFVLWLCVLNVDECLSRMSTEGCKRFPQDTPNLGFHLCGAVLLLSITTPNR